MSSLEAAGLEAHTIGNLMDVEVLRLIRNECRLYMTGDIKPITAEAQSAWYDEYRDHGREVIQVWLILRAEGNWLPIGFLALRYYHETTRPGDAHKTWGRGKAFGSEQNHAVITLGLKSTERDRGYGTAIYRFAREVAGCPIRAEIYGSNARSIKAAEKAGYILTPPYTQKIPNVPVYGHNPGTVSMWAEAIGEDDGRSV